MGGVGRARYAALCLTGCAGVAVLGARRPGAGPWNFVALGLLVVLLLPLAEGFGRLSLSLPRLLFLAATLAVSFLNYFPTRLAPAALLAAAGCGIELWSLTGFGESPRLVGAGRLTLAAAPWAAFLMTWRRTQPKSEFDRTWLRFRDSFGGLWAERLREQFNRAVANAGLNGQLGWGGLPRPQRRKESNSWRRCGRSSSALGRRNERRRDRPTHWPPPGPPMPMRDPGERMAVGSSRSDWSRLGNWFSVPSGYLM